MDIVKFVDEVISQFPKGNKNFNDFLRYFNSALEKKIVNQKNNSSKDKYIKIRKTGLQYILAHQKEIQASINK
jgi:hypothetical protein